MCTNFNVATGNLQRTCGSHSISGGQRWPAGGPHLDALTSCTKPKPVSTGSALRLSHKPTSPQAHWERNCKWRLIHIYKGDAHRGKKEPPAQVEEEPSGLPVWGLKASANFWYSLKWQQEGACVQGLMSLREIPSHTALGSPIYGEHPGPVLTALVPGNPAALCELPFKVTFLILQSLFEPYKIIGQRQMTKGTITSWNYHSPSQDTWDSKSSHHGLCHMSTRGKEQAWSPPTI